MLFHCGGVITRDQMDTELKKDLHKTVGVKKTGQTATSSRQNTSSGKDGL